MPSIRRKGKNAFVDEVSENKTAICHRCYDQGIESLLVPYIMEDGRRDDHFQRCPNCSLIIPRKATKHKSLEGPLGSVVGLGSPTFEVHKSSSIRRTRQNRPQDDLKQDIPKLAGKPDRDLEFLVNEGAIITSLSDDFIEEE